MLKHKLKFLLIFILIVSVSCQKENVDEEIQELPANALSTLKYLTENLGYDESDFEVNLDSQEFINGDFGISFKLSDNINKSGTANGIQAKNQWIGQPVYYSNSKSIYYYMESDFPQNYRTPFAWAAWHWTAVSTNISIRRTYTKSQADVVLSTFDDSTTGAYARAGGPTGDGNVGTYLNINIAKNHTSSSSADKMVLMLHELGHTLGFHHSDVTTGNHIVGTNNATYHTNNNCGSIMRSSVYTCGWTLSATAQWTVDDGKAIDWAY